MALYKRGNKWWFQFEVNGKQIRKSARTSDRDIAEMAYLAEKAKLAKERIDWDSFVKSVSGECAFWEAVAKYIDNQEDAF